ncbi:MAG TPA: YciI family protein [Ktedonobacterales bacterium]|jgi:uncharacterized protein YciI
MASASLIYYAVVQDHAENWDASVHLRQQQGWDEHAAFMDALVDDGSIILGGPLGDGGEQALLIFAAASKEAIEAKLAADPWRRAGMLRTASITRWKILLDGRSRP